MRSSRGRAMSARPMASICCSPPERLAAKPRRRSRRIGNRSNTSSMSAAIASRSLRGRVTAPSVRLSSTLIPGHTNRPCGTWTIPALTIVCGCHPATGRPSMAIVPPRGARSPLRVFRIVVLPAPLPPRRATTSFSGTSKVTSRMTSVTSYQTLRCSTLSIGFRSEPGHLVPDARSLELRHRAPLPGTPPRPPGRP